jgi:hypothetical protein
MHSGGFAARMHDISVSFPQLARSALVLAAPRAFSLLRQTQDGLRQHGRIVYFFRLAGGGKTQ